MNGNQPTPLLSVRGLNAWYESNSLFRPRTPARRVLDGVSLEIGEGEVLGLVGESGCGKTTLARALLGLSRTWSGTVAWSGTVLPAGKGTPAAKLGVQAVFQDPYSSLNPSKRIGWLLEEPLRVQRIGDASTRRAMADAMLLKVGLDPGYRDRYPAELSGGQRQRIAIGMGLITRPKLLVADEPVSSLDVSVQAQILNLMKDLQEEYGFSCLFITHSLRVVRFMAGRIAVMQGGRIIENASTEKLFSAPEHPYTRSFLAGEAKEVR
ncbi:MAG: ABC transporter ATP-binding protein [Clostridia bacterium]|nr:ABC transporter ATP-binding protein [Clostridia bacterium]